MTNRSKTVKFLMATTAAIAIGTASVLAQDVWVSVEGGVPNFTTGYASYTSDISGYSGGSYDIGSTQFDAAFEIGINLANSPYSISLGMRTSTESHDYWTGYYEESASFTTLDFEVGREVSLGGSATGRMTLGVRSASVNTSETSYWGDWYGEGAFTGVGPRVALEATIPVMNNLSLDVEVGAAVLFGTTTSFGDGYYYSASSGDETVTNMDFSAALSYLVSPTSKVSLGYRFEQFDGLDMYSWEQGPTDSVTSQGAFLKFTTGF